MFLDCANDKFIIYHLTIMRKSIPKEKRNQSFGISFPPSLRDKARKRAFQLEISLSAYLQRLVEKDLLHTAKKSPDGKIKNLEGRS